MPLKYNCRLYGFFTKEVYNNNGTWCWILECNHMHLPLTDLGCTCRSLRRLVFCTASWIKEVATEMKSQHKTKFDLLKAGFLLGLHPRNYKYTSPSKYIYIYTFFFCYIYSFVLVCPLYLHEHSLIWVEFLICIFLYFKIIQWEIGNNSITFMIWQFMDISKFLLKSFRHTLVCHCTS